MRCFESSIVIDKEFIPIRIEYEWKGKTTNPTSYEIKSVTVIKTGEIISEMTQKEIDNILYKINNYHNGTSNDY